MADEQTKTENGVGPENELFSWKVLIRIAVVIFLTFSCCILFFFTLYRFTGFTHSWKVLAKAAQPIIIGVVLAFIMNPVMKTVESLILPTIAKQIADPVKAKKLSRAIGITITSILLVTGIALAIWAIVPTIVSSVLRLVRMLPTYVNSTMEMVENGYFGDSEIMQMLSVQISQGVDFVEKWATQTLLPQAQTYITQITSGLITVLSFFMDFIIGIIVMIYVMAIQETLSGQAKKLIYAVSPARVGNIIVELVRKSNDVFGGFFAGKIVDSLIIGVIAYIGCRIMHIPDSVLIASIIGVTNIIPFFGPFIGAVPSIALVVIQSPWHALYLLIFILVLQQVDGNIIGPKILGNSTGLSSFWVMVSILIGGGLFGFAGMLLGVPVFAIIYYIARQMINSRIRAKKLPVETDVYVGLDHVDLASGQIILKGEPRKKHKEKKQKTPEAENPKKES